MKKKILVFLSIILVILISIIVVLVVDILKNNKTDITYNEEIICEEIPQIKVDPLVLVQEEMNNKITSIQCDDKEEWFIQYKKILNEYDGILKHPDTIYDVFSGEELEKLYGVVQAEVGDEWSFECKVNVVNVIFNRLKDDNFPNTLDEVLSPNEFCTVKTGAYEIADVSNTTILACEYAYLLGDTTDGSLYFESKNSNKHNLYVTENKNINDEAHKFYK